MAVRCPGCGRLSRDETVCEWCRTEIPPAARRFTAAAAAGTGTAVGEPSTRVPDPEAVDAVSRQEAAEAAAEVRQEAEAAAEEPLKPADGDTVAAEALVEETELRRDNATLVILLLILLQLGLTLYLGWFSWWSLTGILWLVVGYGVKERFSWALALPLVLFTLDVSMLLFGVGPRERAGFYSLAPLDFFLYLFRLVIWGLIWRLRDELA